MKTRFNFNTQRFRHMGLIIILFFFLGSLIDGFNSFRNHQIYFYIVLFIAGILEIIILWLYPSVEIMDDGLLLKRGLFRDKISWKEILEIKEGERKLDKFNDYTNRQYVKVDQRYAKLLFNKRIGVFRNFAFLVGQMENYDAFLAEIKDRLKK